MCVDAAANGEPRRVERERGRAEGGGEQGGGGVGTPERLDAERGIRPRHSPAAG